jgi:Spy/CpxP family protein refolding chaperone
MTAIVLFVVFVGGLATGAAVVHLTHGHPPMMGPPLGGLRGIDLSKEQRAQTDAIWAKYKPQIDAILRESFPRVRAIDEQMSHELRAALTPEQQKIFDQNEAHRPSPDKGFPPGPPPFPPPPGPEMPPPGVPPGDRPPLPRP